MWHTKKIRIRKGEIILNNTALSAAHMVEVSIEPGGGSELIKVRLQGTKEDMDWLEKQLKGCNQIKIAESSEI